VPLPVLLDDALRVTADGFELRLSLPWIRSLPLAGLGDLAVTIDDAPIEVEVRMDRDLSPEALTGRTDWWYIQDRVVLTGPGLAPGDHDVMVSFTLAVPYLAAGPDGPLRLPFRASRRLTSTDPVAGARRDVA